MHIRQVWSDRNDVHIRIKRLEKTAFQTCVDGNDLRFFPVKFLINLYGLTAQRRIHRKGPFRIIVFEAYLSMSCLCQYRHLIAHHLFQRAHRTADGACNRYFLLIAAQNTDVVGALHQVVKVHIHGLQISRNGKQKGQRVLQCIRGHHAVISLPRLQEQTDILI